MPDIDPQDPLPEPSMFWRRWITVSIILAGGLFVWWQAPRVPKDDLLTLIGWVLLFDFGALTFYFTGSSAAELSALLANFKLRIGKGPDA